MSGLLQRRVGRQSGFTLVELIVVIVIVGALLAVAVPSYLGFRGRAIDRVAQSDLRQAIPSAEAYATDNGGYSGMSIAALRASDSDLASSIDRVVVSGGGSGYCLGATVDAESWSVRGPGGAQWYMSDDCAAGTDAVP